MDWANHAILFGIFWWLSLIGNIVLNVVNTLPLSFDSVVSAILVINWKFFKALIFSFIITNPDIDLFIVKTISKMKGKHKKEHSGIPMLHRWWFSHSIFYPIMLYWLIKDYVVDGFDAKEFGLILFLPVLIHLIGDFRVKNLLNDDPMDTVGTWRISIYPFRNPFSKRKTYRLGEKASVLWMILNVIATIIYILIIY